jgi:hypothetical protein
MVYIVNCDRNSVHCAVSAHRLMAVCQRPRMRVEARHGSNLTSAALELNQATLWLGLAEDRCLRTADPVSPWALLRPEPVGREFAAS